MWRTVTCTYCGLRYRDFRADDQPSFGEAYAVQFRASVAFAATGDYSKPASRRAVLGLMHEVKRGAWLMHIHYCEAEHGSTAILSG